MSDDKIDNLPSIDEFTENLEDLPSAEELIKEENLPSIDEMMKVGGWDEPPKEEKKEEETEEEEEKNKDLTEVLRLINDVRKDIPNIPEIKYYDEPLEKLSAYVEQIKESIPEVKYYDHEVESICEQIDLVREEIRDLPEVKYYDEQVTNIEDRVDLLRQEVVNLPEVKYYDKEIEAICEAIDNVRAEIPTFPKWVNEVNEVPDFSWIGKTFSVIDEDFVEVGDKIKDMASKFDADIHDLTESLDTKDFEQRVQIDEVKDDIKKTKEKIFEELKEAAIRIWDHHTQFKDDDRKLKKQVLSKLNETKQNIEKQILDFNVKNYEENKTLTKYFEGLREEIGNLPEVKYYDNPIKDLKTDLSNLEEKREEQSINIAELYKIVSELKETQEELKEVYNDRPIGPDPALKQGQDPLTPTDQKFATLQDLAANYRLFVNRVEQQLYTIGGGGAGFLKDLDDVNISGLVDGDTIIWNSSTSQWDVGSISAGSTAWIHDSVGIHTLSNVGIATTARADSALYVEGNATVTGNLNVTGDLEYDEAVARNWNITGIATAAEMHVGVDTGFFTEDLVVNGDARITGILTVGRTSVTVDGTNNIVNVGAGITLNATTGKIMAPEIVTVGTSGAFYPPVLNTTERDALTVTQGAMIFNTTDGKIQFYDGSTWQTLPGMTLGLTVALDG